MKENKRRGQPRELILPALFLVLIPAELWCAQAAYETLGEVPRGMYWAATIFGNLLVLLTAPIHRRAAFVMALLVGLMIIPYQLVLVRRHSLVRAEAIGIVTFAYAAKAQTGNYPADLSSYKFQRPEVAKYIKRYSVGGNYGGFRVTYRVGTVNTSHWYTPDEGWSYYPD